MSPVRLVLLALLTIVLNSGSSFAAQHLVPTKTLLVRNSLSVARRILWKVSEPGSAATVVGDPTADGATLRVVLTNGGDQCVTMPSTGWTAIGSIGFRYKDPTLANGPVKVAQIKKTPSGTFKVKAILKNGGPTSISVVPSNPTTSYATNFTLGVGDDYCGGTATATPNPNDARTFKVSNDGAPAGCVTACNASCSPEVYGNAVYFGRSAFFYPNELVGSQVSVAIPGTLTHLALIAQLGGPQVVLALYSDSGGNPDQLIATTAATALVAGVMEIPVAATPLAAGNYWIMGVYDAEAHIGADSSVTGAVVSYVSHSFSAPPPDPFPPPTTYTGTRFNYYVRTACS